MHRILAPVLAIAVLAVPAAADAAAATKKSPEMERLAFLVGAWKATETYERTDTSPGGSGTGVEAIREAAGGEILVGDVEAQTPFGPSLAHTVYSWDAAEGRYVVYWFDNSGYSGALPGKWEGTTLVFEGDDRIGEHSFHVRFVLSEITSNSYTTTTDVGVDGATPVRAVTARYTRRKS